MHCSTNTLLKKQTPTTTSIDTGQETAISNEGTDVTKAKTEARICQIIRENEQNHDKGDASQAKKLSPSAGISDGSDNGTNSFAFPM